MEWIKNKDYHDTYYTEKYFNGYRYVVTIWFEVNSSTTRFWVMVSSGKKRKELSIFEDKEFKSLGGIKALLWVKGAVLSFPSFYEARFKDCNKKVICIRWADSRRRDIYTRLKRDGFYFMHIDGEKTLIKYC